MWDAERKTWNVRLEYYREIYGHLEEYCFKEDNVQLQCIPSFAFDLTLVEIPFSKNFAFDEVLSKLDYTKDHDKNYSIDMIPESLKNQLFNFQKEGVQFGI